MLLRFHDVDQAVFIYELTCSLDAHRICPDRNVIGISKLPRIADMFSRRLQIQERLTEDVAGAIMEILKPQGVAVVMESSHLCMIMRGVSKTTATTTTSCVLGCMEKQETRSEFFSLVGLNR